MTNYSIFLYHITPDSPPFLKAEEGIVKIARTGVFICLRGEAHCTLDGSEFHITPHTLTTYFAFSELQILNRSEDLNGILIGGDLETIQPLLYKVSDFNSLFMIRKNPVVKLTEKQEKNTLMYAQLLEDSVNRLMGKYDDEETICEHIKDIRKFQTELLANSFMLNVVTCYNQFNTQEKLTTRKEDVLMRFISSLYKNYRTQHEVSFYSEQQYLTARYFSAIIKAKSGKTPSQWIATALLVEAKKLLKQTPMSIKEVNDHLHFPNQSYFGKWFKNLTGISPLDYKNGMEEKTKIDADFYEMVSRSSGFVYPPKRSLK